MPPISAGLVNVTGNLNVSGVGSSGVNATTVTADTISATEINTDVFNFQQANIDVSGNLTVGGTASMNNLNLTGQLSINDSQYTNETFETFIKLQQFDFNMFPLLNTTFSVKVKINKVGNQVTLNFPIINVNVTNAISPFNPYGAVYPPFISQYCAYIGSAANFEDDDIPVGYRPGSTNDATIIAANGSSSYSIFNDTYFLGDISGNVLTVRQVTRGNSFQIGSVLTDASGYISTGTTITGLGTGYGGTGTYYLNKTYTEAVPNNSHLRIVQNNTNSLTSATMPGYKVSISPHGSIRISGISANGFTQKTQGEGLPEGPNTILPFSISYLTESNTPALPNVLLDQKRIYSIDTSGWSNSTSNSTLSQFIPYDVSGYWVPFKNFDNPQAQVRDQFIPAILNNKVAFAWPALNYTDSSSTNVFFTNICFRKGTVDASGLMILGNEYELTKSQLWKLDVSSNYIQSQLANLYDYYGTSGNLGLAESFGSSVSFNTINPNNIVVSWPVHFVAPNQTTNAFQRVPYNAVSFDGGETFPAEWNCPINNLGRFGSRSLWDDRGVKCDIYGNFWKTYGENPTYKSGSAFNITNDINAVSISADGTIWNTAYSFDVTPTISDFAPTSGIYWDSFTMDFGYSGNAYDSSNVLISTTVSGTQTVTPMDTSGILTTFSLNVANASRFPNPSTSNVSGQFNIINSSGVYLYTCTYTGISGNTLTGCIASGQFVNSLTITTGFTVKCLGQYGVWLCGSLMDPLVTNLTSGALVRNNTWTRVIFIPITGKLNKSNNVKFTGFVDDGTGSGSPSATEGTVLTVTDVALGTLQVDQMICGQNKNVLNVSGNTIPFNTILDSQTKILSQISGTTGGVGTYRVNVKQKVASQTVYGAIVPTNNGPENYIPPTTTTDPSGTLILATDTSGCNWFTLNVASTDGFPQSGVILITNDSSGDCTLTYNGTTPTSFLNVYTIHHGVGNGFVLPSGSRVESYKKDAFLKGIMSYLNTVSCGTDGRLYVNCWMFSSSNLLYKSPPAAPTSANIAAGYCNPLSSNWGGPYTINTPTPTVLSLLNQTFPINSTSFVQNIIYDEKRGTIFAIVGSDDNKQNAQFYLTASRDNGQTWSDKPILIRDVEISNSAMCCISQDTLTKNIASMWIDSRLGSVPVSFPPYFSAGICQFYASILPSGSLDTLIAGYPNYSSNINTVKPRTNPPFNGGPGLWGNVVR